MSRTYRRPATDKSEEGYIKQRMGWEHRRSEIENGRFKDRVRHRKPREQYDAEVKAARAYDYANAATMPYPYYTYVNRYWYEDVWVSFEERAEEYRKEYAKLSRDGRMKESGRNRGFKHTNVKQLRAKHRALYTKIVKDDDYDHKPYPDAHDGDYLRWSFW